MASPVPQNESSVSPAHGWPFFHWINTQTERLTKGKYWLVPVTLIAIVLALFLNTPSPSTWAAVKTFWTFKVLEEQVAAPLTPLSPAKHNPNTDSMDAGHESHMDKLAFRLTIPVIGHALGLGRYSWIACSIASSLIIFPAFAWLVSRGLGGGRIEAAYLTWALAVTWTAENLFTDFTFGDSVAFAGILAAMCWRQPLWILGCCLVAMFTDERGFIGCIAVSAYWWFKQSPGEPLRLCGVLKPQPMAVLAAAIIYGSCRVLLHQWYGLSTGDSMIMQSEIVWTQLRVGFPYRAFSILEFLWVIPFLAVLFLVEKKDWARLFIFSSCGLLLLAAALMVWDWERSVAYLIVLIPLAAAIQLPIPASYARIYALSCFLVGVLLSAPWNTPLRWARSALGG